jgi:DNA-binding GntR family transcriptional regulator
MLEENKASWQANDALSGAKNLTETVYRQMKSMMLKYQLVPGQRLLFADLARRLGVSRTPVNTALSILATEGLLDFVPDQGYNVHQITRDEASHLYDLREIIELGAIAKAMDNVTPSSIAKLKKQKILYEKAIDDNLIRGRFPLDQEFHAAYIGMAGNPILVDYFREAYERVYLCHPTEALPRGRAKEVMLEHNALFDAIKNKDMKASESLIREHIRKGKEYILRNII